MDAVLESWTAYLNRQTGEIYSFPDELEALDEDDLDEEDDELDVDFPPEELPKVREILGSEDWLPLPTKFDIHEWNIMRGFCDTVADAGLRDELQEAIHGRGAFRWFKDAVHRHGVEKTWYQFRDEALDEIAKDWLEEHEVPYVK